MRSLGFFQVWSIFLLIKLALGFWLPFFSDEAYYWVWSHNIQLSYYDHPPFVAWLFWFGHLFEDFGQGSRWAAIVMGHSLLLIWNEILKPYFDSNKRYWWLWLAGCHPITGIGTTFVTPDVPLLFFWSLAIMFLLQAQHTRTWSAYAGLGVALGLGFCSKYQIVLFVPAALLWLFGEKPKIVYSKLALTLGIGLILCLPVLMWNHQNDYDSFLFQLKHGFAQKKWQWFWISDFIGSQMALIFPTVLFFSFKNKMPPHLRWLVNFSVFPFLLFFISSFRGRVEANWTAVAFPTLLTMAIVNTKKPTWIKATVAIWIGFYVLVLSHVVFRWIPLKEPHRLKTNEFVVFDSLLSWASEKQPFFASSYQMASQLTYKLGKPVYKLNGMTRRDFFDYLEQSHPSTEEFILATRLEDVIPPTYSGYGVSLVETIDQKYKILKFQKTK